MQNYIPNRQIYSKIKNSRQEDAIPYYISLTKNYLTNKMDIQMFLANI